MKIALLGDLHGNMTAVEAVDQDMKARRLDAIYCLGDLIGKGPQSPETMDWALARCEIVLQGNWDEVISRENSPFPDSPWYRKQLGKERLRVLSMLPPEHRFLFSGRRVRLLHGRPIVPDTVYSDSALPERLRLFETDDDYRPNIVGFSDIHRPFFEQITDAGTLFNTGSVGNPLARQPYATYAILEGQPDDAVDTLTHTIVQVPYDREEAMRLALQAPDLPGLDAYINELRTGLYSR